jgi:hypothetical protein
MSGLVTERDFRQAELSFPGITQFYYGLPSKPPTFLQLVWQYVHRDDSVSAGPR